MLVPVWCSVRGGDGAEGREPDSEASSPRCGSLPASPQRRRSAQEAGPSFSRATSFDGRKRSEPGGAHPAPQLTIW